MFQRECDGNVTTVARPILSVVDNGCDDDDKDDSVNHEDEDDANHDDD